MRTPQKYATPSLHTQKMRSRMGPTQGPQNTTQLEKAWITVPLKIGEGWGIVMYHILLRLCSDVSDVSGHAVTLSQYSDTRSFRTLHNLHSFKIHMLHPLHDPLHDPCHHSRFCGNTIIFCYISFLWLTIVLLL